MDPRRGTADDEGGTPSSPAVHEDTFDVIIVGAGPSSIGLLYGLLVHSSSSSSKLNDFRIAVVERGSGPPHHRSTANVRDWFTAAHGGNFFSTGGGAAAVIHTTAPQRGLNGRVHEAPAGSGLGGGTNVNACLYSRPDFGRDFDDWPGRWKGGVLLEEAVDELERVMDANGGLHRWTTCDRYHEACGGDRGRTDGGREGPNWEEDRFPKHIKMEYVPSFLLAANSKLQRVNYYDSTLYPLLKSRPDLQSRVTFFTDTSVQRVLFRGNTATGVECRGTNGGDDDNRPFTLRTSGEVVLCAGAFASPALLMVSGVGDGVALGGAGISPVVADLPAVGGNLRDHTILARAYVTPPQFGRRTSASCVQAHYMVTIPKKGARGGGGETGGGEEGESAEPEESASDDTKKSSTNNEECYRVQLSLTDGAVSTVLLPYFLACPLRRGFESEASPSTVVMLNRAYWFLFAVVRLALRVLLAFSPLRSLVVHCTATINVCMLNPRSTGSVSVRPKRRGRSARGDGGVGDEGESECIMATTLDDVELRIDPGYLTDVDDEAALVAAWGASDAVARRHFGACAEVLPGPLLGRLFRRMGGTTTQGRPASFGGEGSTSSGIEGWLVPYASHFLHPYYHWCGTCAMGGGGGRRSEGTPSDEDGDEDGRVRQYVVDEDLRVHGVRNLRVCDASVFPTCISAPTALTCAGIGYAISKSVANDVVAGGRDSGGCGEE